jgi:hypothetical protein
MAAGTTAMPSRYRGKNNDWLWRPAHALAIPPAGDVVVREPHEGWSPGFYEAVLQRYVAVRRAYPRTARMHPSTALAVAPADRAAPVWWPVYDIRRHYAPTRIILSDDELQMPEPGWIRSSPKR